MIQIEPGHESRRKGVVSVEHAQSFDNGNEGKVRSADGALVLLPTAPISYHREAGNQKYTSQAKREMIALRFRGQKGALTTSNFKTNTKG